MKSLFLLLMLMSFAVQAARYKVVGYVSGSGQPLTVTSVNAKKLTHVHYTFAHVMNGEVCFADPTKDSINLSVLHSLQQINPRLKVLVSIGGKDGSAGFPDAVRTDSTREKFIKSLLAFVKKYRLDGLELHWIAKARGMYGNSYSKSDQHNFALLIQQVRDALDEQSIVEKRKKKNYYILSMMGSSKRQYLFRSELNVAQRYLDYITVQTYDYKVEILNSAGISDAAVTGHHCSLKLSYSDSWMRLCADKTIREYREYGIARKKLILGIAFYGQGWINAYEQDNGLYQMSDGRLQEDLSYKNISANYFNNPSYEHYWDKHAKAPSLYNKKNGTFISYEDKKSIRKKTGYIRRKKLGGAVVSECTQDANGILLRSVRRGTHRITIPYLFF
ncbi:MAG TPA: glycoside hydrolase family 18 protein [Cytophagaceae bacterium]|jgi:chitinase|nr:glycoside hydrolase family 18 protein [Cytophagaceae bacterium]